MPEGVILVRPPWRADDLPKGHFMATTFGHGGAYPCRGDTERDCAIDLRARRFDGAAWTDSKIEGPPTRLDEYVGWELPLYSPVDGEIVACWRNIPDDLLGGDEPPECGELFGYGPPPEGCMGGGNHVLIRTDEGYMIFLGHMRQWSVPAALCSHPDDAPLPGQSNALNRKCELDGYLGWRTQTFIDPPIPVKRGELLGKMGNSGNSDVPHLHMDVREYTNDDAGNYCLDLTPWAFADSYYQVRHKHADVREYAWQPLHGTWPKADGSAYLVYGDW